jgi:hypothetical protein
VGRVVKHENEAIREESEIYYQINADKPPIEGARPEEKCGEGNNNY